MASETADSVSGRIAKLPYPEANIIIAPFEKTKMPENFFDVAYSNVPLGDYPMGDEVVPGDRHALLLTSMAAVSPPFSNCGPGPWAKTCDLLI